MSVQMRNRRNLVFISRILLTRSQAFNLNLKCRLGILSSLGIANLPVTLHLDLRPAAKRGMCTKGCALHGLICRLDVMHRFELLSLPCLALPALHETPHICALYSLLLTILTTNSSS